jgi:hypothetical protein
MKILGIDPGNVESAWSFIDAEDMRPIEFAKAPNEEVRASLRSALSYHGSELVVAIEKIASYGMAVGESIFDTCIETGRFVEITQGRALLVKRADVKLHHCHSMKAKDGNIIQALKDRFGDKGTKKTPGWFYGFKADAWQAHALAVYVADHYRESHAERPRAGLHGAA